jgi:hypothetical protein
MISTTITSAELTFSAISQESPYLTYTARRLTNLQGMMIAKKCQKENFHSVIILNLLYHKNICIQFTNVI